jgi:glycosyltransferase involved in cell wall biosynthesis
MNNKIVSICVPTYNRPNLIGYLLDSILQQSYQAFEIIITDNSDNLDTFNLIDSKFKDKRVRYFKNKCNLGMDGNTLLALSKVEGAFFTFTPDDDIWIDNNKLSKQVEYLERTNLNCCFSNALHLNFDGTLNNKQFLTIKGSGCKVIDSTDLLLTKIKTEYFLCVLTGLFRTKYLDLFKISWTKGSEELFLWYLGGVGEPLCFCYENLVAIRDGDHNWQINNGNGGLTNFRENKDLRSKQILEIYKYLIANFDNELINFNKKTEILIAQIIFDILGFRGFKYIRELKKISYNDLPMAFLNKLKNYV